jgi:nucleotide-binding universal stress UspA family protein
MYRNLLVPLALADAHDADAPLRAVRALADEGAKITLLHVIEEVPPQAAAFLPEHYVTDMQRDRLAELQRRAEGLPGVTAEIATGSAGALILDRAAALGVDCIVIASHRPGLRDWFLGSTAARVVRHAQCAVHVVR